MSKHKYIQPIRFITHQNKSDAISLVEREINDNYSAYTDGELVVIGYLGEDGNLTQANAIIVKKEGEAAKVEVTINEKETLKIVESDNEPRDKKVLWLKEDEDESETVINLKHRIDDLTRELSKLRYLVDKHDYALSNTIAGGDIITNSEKYAEENSADPEAPYDAEPIDGEYASEDFLPIRFEVYLGNSEFFSYYTKTKLYKGQKLYLKVKFFNQESEEINPDDIEGTTGVTMLSSNGRASSTVVADFIEGTTILEVFNSGNTNIEARVTVNERELPRRRFDAVTFEYNEEPYYKKYEEPNVHHFILKSVATLDILKKNLSYLCINEPIWCIGDAGLYMKVEIPNGEIMLVKLNGSGSDIIPPDPDTGDTPSVSARTTFVVTLDERLLADSTDNSVYVSEDGTLRIASNAGEVSAEGVLILNDSITTGGTPDSGDDDTPVDPGSSSTGNVDNEGNLDIGGNTTLNSGILSLNAVVENGVLKITT